MIDYTISHEPPEGIYERCVQLWGVDFDTTVWTYGNTIHAKNDPSPNLLAHELVHVRQQTEMDKDEWWMRYFADPQFRLEQEVEAYRAQYRNLCGIVSDRNRRASYLLQYADALSGTMYGNLITRGEAIKLITK